LASATQLVRRYGCVVAISDPVDHILDADRHVIVSSGHEWMTRVTGVGCSLGALTAAFAGIQNDHLIAAVSATAMLCVAAERAAERSAGPGAFAQALVDELFLVSPDEVGERGGLRDVTA
jgi:hydroxyethylthiazole kinase